MYKNNNVLHLATVVYVENDQLFPRVVTVTLTASSTISIMNYSHTGFTIVELIVVITVIGILASIGLISYNGYLQRANDTSVTSDLTNLSDQLEIYRTRSGAADRYPSTVAELQTIGAKLNRTAYKTVGVANNAIICMTGDFKTFTIIALSNSGNVLAATKDGMITYTQPASTFGTGACSSVYSMNAPFAGWQASAWQSWTTG